MAHGSREVEIKLAIADAASARRMLRAAGFRVSRRRVFERNTVYDTPARSLRARSSLLRLREAGGAFVLTYKGPPEAGPHKSREELELELPEAGVMAAILERLGLEQVWRYEKYRTEFRQARGAGLATLDETPLGIYVELEGAPGWIDRTARRLGFAEHDYITASYGTIYLERCARERREPGDMVFES
jgi:adenylate cyclase class 2